MYVCVCVRRRYLIYYLLLILSVRVCIKYGEERLSEQKADTHNMHLSSHTQRAPRLLLLLLLQTFYTYMLQHKRSLILFVCKRERRKKRKFSWLDVVK